MLAPGFFDAVAGCWLFTSSSNIKAAESASGALYTDLSGAMHVHSTYSDGASEIPVIMEAAKKAGVDFVLLSDHNTLQPLADGWEGRYNQAPLLLIGTEVTLRPEAYILALDVPAGWTIPFKESHQRAIDSVSEHDGLPFISLPFDIKSPWTNWDVEGVTGMEVINLSTIARRHINLASLCWLIPRYRRGGSLHCVRSLLTRPDSELAVWDRLTSGGRRVVGIGSLDAHALMKIGKNKYPIPSYEDSFKALTTHVLVSGEDTASGLTRAGIYEALSKGRCYISYDVVGNPKGFSFSALTDNGWEPMGSAVSLGTGVQLSASIPGERTLLRLIRNGKCICSSHSGVLLYHASQPGTYRVEAFRFHKKIGPLFTGIKPWVFSNPIYVSG